MNTLKFAIVAVIGIALSTGSVMGTTLTGVNAYGTDMTGSSQVNSSYWSSAPGPGLGLFVWDYSQWLNDTRTADLNYDLTPGFYTLDAYGDTTPDLDVVAINLFFNNNTTGGAQISALAWPNTGVWDVNSSPANLPLPGSPGTPSGTLVFDDGKYQVSLVNLYWLTLGTPDAVSAAANMPGIGSAPVYDSLAHIVLEVSESPVPEPSTCFLTSAAVLAAAIRARKRNND